MIRMRLLPCLALALVLAACSRPQPPDTERPPEPQAGETAEATALREAMQAPIDRAHAAEASVQEAAQRQQAAIDAAGG